MRTPRVPHSAGHVVPDDAHLVLRVLNGDRHAFARLVERHQATLYRMARALGLDHDTASDLVQDTFLRAWERLAECRDPGAFRGWLYRILRNLCLDHLKNRRRQVVPLSALPEAAEPPDPREELDPATRVALGEALAALPALLREAFLLRHDAGYSYEEIGELVDASPSAVKMRVHRARASLCALLDGGGEGGHPEVPVLHRM